MKHVASQFPDRVLNLRPLHWKCRVLSTGLPRSPSLLSVCYTDCDLWCYYHDSLKAQVVINIF